MNGLDLYSGSGIGTLTFKHIIPNYQTVCYIECDPYCQAILLSRIQDGLLDNAPIWDDVRTFDGTIWRGKVDFVFGGFPCQPFSVAGQRKGSADKRNLWPDTARIIGEIRPRYAFLENVPGLLSSGYFETILCDLAEIGYDVEWDTVGASDVGACHRRKRVWILAYDSRTRQLQSQGLDENERGRISDRSEDVADTKRKQSGKPTQSKGRKNSGRGSEKEYQDVADTEHAGRNATEKSAGTIQRSDNITQGQIATGESQGCSNESVADTNLQRRRNISTGHNKVSILRCGSSRLENGSGNWWTVEPDVGRVVDGLAFRVERLRMLGNGWVPAVVARILKVDSLRQRELKYD